MTLMLIHDADSGGGDRGVKVGESVGLGEGSGERRQACRPCNRVALCNPVAQGEGVNSSHDLHQAKTVKEMKTLPAVRLKLTIHGR